MRDLAVAEKADQWKFTECRLDHLQLFRIRAKKIGAAPEAGIVNAAARLRIQALLHAVEHARHVFRRTRGIAAAEHDRLAVFDEIADRNDTARRIDADEIAHEII